MTSAFSKPHPKSYNRALKRRLKIKRLLHMNTAKPYSGSSSSRGGFVCGHVSVMGRRRAMEDAVTVAPGWLLGGDYAFFAVYDGHGGSKVAETCSEKLHTCLAKHIEDAKKEKRSYDWENMMKICFSSIDETFEEASDGGEGKKVSSAEKMMGSTAVVVLLGKEEIVVANCGDSRAVICHGGVAVPLSADHKPDRPDERKRIEDVGGKVLNWNGWRVEGLLATSRSLGDHHLKPYVSSEPEVAVMKRTELDSFLILASDGLWDVVSNELACEFVGRCLSSRRGTRSSEGASDAAAKLAELAVAKGSRGNISVIVVQLI